MKVVENANERVGVGNVLMILALAGVIMWLAGCGSTGWKMEIGMVPITGIDHHETLVQQEMAKSENEKRRY
jgi:hypothetical protein